MPRIRLSNQNAPIRLGNARTRPAGGFGDTYVAPLRGDGADPEEETPDPAPTGTARLTIAGMRVAAGGLQIGVGVMIDGEPATGSVSENAMVGGMWTTTVPVGEHRVRVTEVGVSREAIVDVPAGGATIALSGMPFAGEAIAGAADLIITGMPRDGSVYLDGGATAQPGRWADPTTRTVLVVRSPVGPRRVRVTDAAGNARTWSGNVGITGAMIAWADLTPVARASTGGAKAPSFVGITGDSLAGGGGGGSGNGMVDVVVDSDGNPIDTTTQTGTTGDLRVASMPPEGLVTIDGALPPGYPTGARWEGSTWVFRAPRGEYTLRITPPTGGGPARTTRVTVGATGNVDFSTMVPEVVAALAVPTVSVQHMPEGGRVYVGTDGVDRSNDPRSTWSGQTWIVPAPSVGTFDVRVAPATGPARVIRNVVVPVGGAVVDFSTMVPETDSPPVSRTDGTVLYRNTRSGPLGGAIIMGESITAVAIRGAAGTSARQLAPVAGRVPEEYTATVPAGTYTIEVIVQPSSAGSAAQQYTGPVTVTAGQITTILRDQLTATGQAASGSGDVVLQLPDPNYALGVYSGTAIDRVWLRAADGTETALRVGPPTPPPRYFGAASPGTYTLFVTEHTQYASGPPTFAPPHSDPPQTFMAPVRVVAGETVTVRRGDMQPAPVADQSGVPPPAGTGRVVVRTVLADANAMVQRLTGSQGEVDAGRSMVVGADGSLSVSVAPGTYQLVAWQGDLTRANVRQAPVTVIAGQTASYSYTGAALTYDGGAQTGGGDQITTPPTPADRAARYAAYIEALRAAGASRTNMLLSPYLWQLGGK